MCTNEGQNLLKPGKTPHENKLFLLFLTAVIHAVDEYADLLRLSATNAGNDHRLGSNEAPPAIISIFLGDQLTEILEQIVNGGVKCSRARGELNIGVSTLPTLFQDTTDRNRTSPFAFTGNKFEYRMVPSSLSVAGPNTVLNTIVAEILSRIADRLEKASDIDAEIGKYIKETIIEHKRIIFNGNNYSAEWVEEAKRRGLHNLSSTVEASKAYENEHNMELFEKHQVYSRVELHSRYEIILDAYVKQINIEALTALDMARRQILPAVIEYSTVIADSIAAITNVSKIKPITQEKLLTGLLNGINLLNEKVEDLEMALLRVDGLGDDTLEHAEYYRDRIFTAMNQVRLEVDKLESIVASDYWPLPTYKDMLFNV